MQTESHAFYVKGQTRTPVVVKSDATYNAQDHQFYFLVANRTDGSMFTVRAEDVVLSDLDAPEGHGNNANLRDIFNELSDAESALN